MKTYLLFLLLCLSLLFSCTYNNNTIKGEIVGLEKGDKIFLTIGTVGATPLLVDSVVVKTDNSFHLETLVTDTYARIYVAKKGSQLDLNSRFTPFFIEGFSTINIAGDINNLRHAKIAGGVYDMPEMIESQNVRDSAQATQSYKLWAKLDSLKRIFRDNNPDVAYSALVLRYDHYELSKGLEHYESLYNKLTPRVRASIEGSSLGEYIFGMKSTAVGAMALDFKAKDVLGLDISLSDFKGKYLLLHFWGTWCSPCRSATPDLVDLYEKVKGDKFEILSIATRETCDATLLKVINDDKMTWRNINDKNSDIRSKYGIQSAPVYFLIDDNGKIIDRGKLGELTLKIEEIILGKQSE